MGVDPGLANTGWGVIEVRGSKTDALAYGCISTEKTQDLSLRLACIYDKISAAIERYEPDALSVEEIYFGANTKSAVATAQARGALLAAAGKHGLELGEYTPMQIKKAVVGTGAADKEQVQYMVKAVLKLDHEPKPDHAADALAAAVCHARMRDTNEAQDKMKRRFRGMANERDAWARAVKDGKVGVEK